MKTHPTTLTIIALALAMASAAFPGEDAAAVAAPEKEGFVFTAESSHPSLSTFILGEKVMLTFTVRGLPAPIPGLNLLLDFQDEQGRSLEKKEVPVRVDAAGGWTGSVAAEKNAPEAQPAPAANPLSAQTPWDLPPLEVLRASRHKVFAHYFSPFPVSIDNRPADQDYYAKQFMTVDGENGKHAAYGGYLRQRPLPRPRREGTDWRQQDLQQEVRLARDAGLDGFTINILTTDDKNGWVRDLLDAAQAVDPAFKVMLMPDMMAGFKRRPEAMVPLLLALASHPAVLRLPDGRLVVAPYCAQVQPVAWWTARLAELKAAGQEVAFVPLFHSVNPAYAPISYGFSDWGGRCLIDSQGQATAAARMHALVPVWMQPVAPQDMRPKSGSFYESSGSATFRFQWESAIWGGADWVHLITWNDYSEATEIAPSTGTGHAFYDLSAYYTAWFKTGTPPPIRRDALLAFHRSQRTDTVLRVQTKP